jgi:hypothetical protein
MDTETTLQKSIKPHTGPDRHWPRWALLVGVALLLTLATFYHYAIYLPQPKQPHRLTILDDVFALGVLLLLGLVGLGLGRRVLRPFNLARFTWLEQCVLALGLGWGALSVLALGLGLARVLYGWLLMVLLGAGLALFWRDGWGLLTALTTRSWYRRLMPLAPRTLFEGALAAVVGVELILVGTQALTLPIYPRGWDDYTYHWAVPQLFLLHHAVYAPPGWANADFPLNTEMLNALALAFDAPIAATLVQMVFGLLAVLLISGWLYRHAGRLAAWLGAALCLGSPLFTGLLTSGYVELAVAYYGTASLVLVLAWLKSYQDGEPPRLRLLLLAGIAAGLGVGSKYQAGQTVIGIVLLLLGVGAVKAVLAWRKRGNGWLALRPFLLGLVTYLLALLLALVPWLARDWLLLGNPVYPLVWGGPAWNDARAQIAVEWLDHFGPQGMLWRRLAEAFLRLFRDNGHMDDIPYQPLNYLLLLAPVLVLLEALRAWRKQPRQTDEESAGAWQGLAWLVVVAGAYSAWVVSQTTSSRYAMPWVLLLAVPAALLLVWLCRVLRKQRVLLGAVQLALLAVFLFLGPLSSWPLWAKAQPLSLLAGQVSLRQWEERHLMQSAGYWQLIDYASDQIPTDAKLLMVGNGFGYFLDGHDYVDDSAEDWVPYLVTAGHTPAGMAALLRQQGYSYLVYQEQNLEFIIHSYKATSLASYLPPFHQFLAEGLVQVRVFGDYTLYRVPAP